VIEDERVNCKRVVTRARGHSVWEQTRQTSANTSYYGAQLFMTKGSFFALVGRKSRKILRDGLQFRPDTSHTISLVTLFITGLSEEKAIFYRSEKLIYVILGEVVSPAIDSHWFTLVYTGLHWFTLPDRQHLPTIFFEYMCNFFLFIQSHCQQLIQCSVSSLQLWKAAFCGSAPPGQLDG
jgi:hypothetical protein